MTYEHIDPTKRTYKFMLDYGYKVKVLEGQNAGKEGYVVMSSRMGDVGINTNKRKVTNNYHIREHPSNLEILSRDNPHSIVRAGLSTDMSEFEFIRCMMMIEAPEVVVKYPEYFSKAVVRSSKNALEINKTLQERMKEDL